MNFAGSLKTWSDVLFTSASTLLTKVAGLLPNLLGAFFLLILGWLVAKLCRGMTRKLLKWTRFEQVLDKSRIKETFETVGITTGIGDVISLVVFWTIFLIFMVSASEVLGLSVVLSTLNILILYIPNIIAAITIIVLSLFLAHFLKDFIAAGLSQINLIYAQPLARFVEILIIIFGLVAAMTQLGFDIGILKANMTIIIGGFVAVVALSLGLGAKTVVQNLLAGYYVRQLFENGQEVILVGGKGKVKQIHSLGLVLETGEGDITIPNHKIIEQGSFR